MKQLTHLQTKVAKMGESICTVTHDDDGICTLEQYVEQLTDLKSDL